MNSPTNITDKASGQIIGVIYHKPDSCFSDHHDAMMADLCACAGLPKSVFEPDSIGSRTRLHCDMLERGYHFDLLAGGYVRTTRGEKGI